MVGCMLAIWKKAVTVWWQLFSWNKEAGRRGEMLGAGSIFGAKQAD